MKQLQVDKIYKLIENTFESNLYRKKDEFLKLVKDKKFNFLIEELDNRLLGFISYWNITSEFLYVEHFVVDKELRGNGVGKLLLEKLQLLSKHQILEVEPPHSEMDIKRIKFYEKFGFILNENEYFQPSYEHNGDKIPLKIMCTKKLNKEEYLSLTSAIHEKVYSRNEIIL